MDCWLGSAEFTVQLFLIEAAKAKLQSNTNAMCRMHRAFDVTNVGRVADNLDR